MVSVSRLSLSLITPVLLRLAHVALITELGHVFAGFEQVIGFSGERFLHGEEAHLAVQEVLELGPVGSF